MPTGEVVMDAMAELSALQQRHARLMQRKAAAEADFRAKQARLAELVEEAKQHGVEDVRQLPDLIAAAEAEQQAAEQDYAVKLAAAEQELAKYESPI